MGNKGGRGLVQETELRCLTPPINQRLSEKDVWRAFLLLEVVGVNCTALLKANSDHKVKGLKTVG